jgi:ABC-type phosphate/phosphonate transport system substrate-binding protein
MKKSVLGIIAGAALMFSLASCGEKLLTDEQVQAEITKGFDAGKAAVEQEMNAKCDADFETRVTAEVDRLKAEVEAAKAAEMPAGKK